MIKGRFFGGLMGFGFIAAAVAAVAGASGASAQQTERCYGVARAAETAGIDDGEAAGGAAQDYQGNAWMLVPQGECLTMTVPPQPDGTPRRGSLEPLDRDRP